MHTISTLPKNVHAFDGDFVFIVHRSLPSWTDLWFLKIEFGILRNDLRFVYVRNKYVFNDLNKIEKQNIQVQSSTFQKWPYYWKTHFFNMICNDMMIMTSNNKLRLKYLIPIFSGNVPHLA